MRRILSGFGGGVAMLLLVGSPCADGQSAAKVYRIGMLETRSAVLNAANLDALRQGLRELGYKEGENLEIIYRSSDGRNERFPGLADELVRRNVDLILTRGTPAALAAKKATPTIPIVMAASGDPVSSGIVASLARPGGNVTGMSSLIPDLNAKRVELLRQVLPRLSRLAVVFNMDNPVNVVNWNAVDEATRSLHITPHLLDVRRAEDLSSVLAEAAKRRPEALFVGVDGVTQGNLRLIAELAIQQRLPSIYGAKEYVSYGGLMAYGANDGHCISERRSSSTESSAAPGLQIFPSSNPPDSSSHSTSRPPKCSASRFRTR